MSVIKDRAQGVLLGLAARDRNGGPIRMAIRVAESLSERRRLDPDDILTRYLAWWREGAFDTGPTAATVLGLIEGGMMAAEHWGGAVRRGIAPPSAVRPGEPAWGRRGLKAEADGTLVCFDAATGFTHWTMRLGTAPSGIMSGDVDGDGKPEVVVSVGGGYVYVLGP